MAATTQDSEHPIGEPAAAPRARPWYSSYVLMVIGLVSIANYYDRNLITILIEPIERDLHLSDGQIGLLSGFGFALMYSLLGVPMARLADRVGRARVLGGVVAIWSVMTVLTGRAVNFSTMLAARVGVSVGEAGGLPTAHALVADYFSPRWRGKAMSTIAVCAALGLSLAMAGGGLINDWRGWRMAFYISGAPGLAIAALVLFTIKEPRRLTASGAPAPAAPLGEAFGALWRRKAYVLLCVGMGLAAIGAYGQQTWTPAFLMRTYHMTTGQIGVRYSAVTAPATLISVLLGGLVNDWLVARDQRWPLWLLAGSFGLSVPFSLVFFLIHDFNLALGLSLITTVFGGLWVGPSYALVQSLAGPRIRALAAAIFMMVVNIIGLGLGPYLTGALSDALTTRFGPAALTVSLCGVSMTGIVGAICFLLAGRTVLADVTEADAA